MTDPLFWLVLSLLFVTVSLTIVLVVAIPALRELSRAARSAEKLFDTLRREFPPTLQAIRLTGLEISDLTDDVSEGVQSAGQVVKQVDQSLTGVRQQAQRVQSSTRSVVVGIKAAWRTFTRPPRAASQRRSADRPSTARLEAESDSALRGENGRFSETLPDTRSKSRRLLHEGELNQPSIARQPDPIPRDSSPPTSEHRLAAPAPSKGEHEQLPSSHAPNADTTTPDPKPRQPEPTSLDNSLEGEAL